MEMTIPVVKEKIKALFLKDKIPFAYKADVNWKMVKKCLYFSVAIGLVILLFLPTPNLEPTFYEKFKAEAPETIAPSTDLDPTEQTIKQMNQGVLNPSPHIAIKDEGSGGDRNTSMILTRGGLDSKTQIPSGSRISVRLAESTAVATSAMPIIGIVTRDFIYEENVAIPAGSRLLGQISFGGEAERAQIDWNSIQLQDGRERQLSAIGVGQDGQIGIQGTVHSTAMKNAVGATISRFIGAYAQGAMETGILGAGSGGKENGLKNAIAQTANAEANAFAEDLKKQKRWMELSPNTEFFAVLTSNFVFRDPGAVNE